MKDSDKKIKIIETLVHQDLGNGRHAQKRLGQLLNNSGKCPKEICQEIKKLKISR